MKKFFLKNWTLIVLFALSGLVVWPLFVRGYFSHHDDLQVMRIFEMRKCITDFQIPCRWVPDMGYGNGYPLFNFYGVFAYYLGAVLSFGFGYIGAAKALFFIPLVFGAVGMYFLARELFGKIPGFLAGTLYLLAPYRALDAYVRGAVAEMFGMAAVPFVLYFILKLLKEEKKKYFVLSAVSFAIFLLSHNIMTLIFTPVIFALTLLFLYENKWKAWKKISLAILLGFGISAFFILPAFIEKNLVQTEALTRAELDFRAQFVKVGQLFLDRSWNYSGSNPNQEGTISYQVGWPHWWLVALAVVSLFLTRKKKVFATLLMIIFTASVFMTHNKSAPIWEAFPILSYVQFPWRFLSIAIFASSLLSGYLASNLRGKTLLILVAITVTITVFFNWRYFRPEHFYRDITDKSKLSGVNFIDQQKGALLDYLPKSALEPRELPIMPSGFSSGTNHWKLFTDEKEVKTFEVPVFDFPNWTVDVDGKIISHSRSIPLGRIAFEVPAGKHTVKGNFRNTSVRSVANIISFLSLCFLVFYAKNRKIFV